MRAAVRASETRVVNGRLAGFSNSGPRAPRFNAGRSGSMPSAGKLRRRRISPEDSRAVAVLAIAPVFETRSGNAFERGATVVVTLAVGHRERPAPLAGALRLCRAMNSADVAHGVTSHSWGYQFARLSGLPPERSGKGGHHGFALKFLLRLFEKG